MAVAMREPVTIAAPLPTSTPGELLALARHGLAEAATTSSPALRYAISHLCALRAASAVLAARARPAVPGTRRSQPVSVWTLLIAVAPEMGEWATFFAGGHRAGGG
jgi:hypothetical protein